MAGTIDLFQRGYGGIDPSGDMLRLEPELPEGIESLSFPLSYRGHLGVEVEIDRRRMRISAPESEAPPITIGLDEEVVRELAAGGAIEFALDDT